VHTTFNQAVVSTGRLSSNKPNFQNIPIKTDIGKEIRKAFIPQNKNHYIYSFDYSQIELRILTHFTSESELLKAFNNKEDIHIRTASLIFGADKNEIDYEKRQIAKTINYSILYGAGPFRISQELKIPIKDASEIIQSYFNSYPQIKNYIDNTVIFGEKHGFVKTLHGRQRKVSNIYSSNKNVVEAEKRAMINMPIQGTASELIKIAMINIDRIFKEKNMQSKMILQIHDELLFEVPKDEIDIIHEIVTSEMENAIDLDVPIKVDSNYGISWFEAH
jgi:DNA polymerase-1